MASLKTFLRLSCSKLVVLAPVLWPLNEAPASEASRRLDHVASEAMGVVRAASEGLDAVDTEDGFLLVRRRLSPPVWVFWGRVQAALGVDTCLLVNEPSEVKPANYRIRIEANCDDESKAPSLAAILQPSYEFVVVFDDGLQEVIRIVVEVVDGGGSPVKPVPMPREPQEATKIFVRALTGNPYFAGLGPKTHYSAFSLVFAKEIIQYYADNISDCFNNNNEIVADAMLDILGLNEKRWAFRVGLGTQPTKMLLKPAIRRLSF